MKPPLKIWANLGVLIEVDQAKFLDSPEDALEEAIKDGKYKPEGFSFVPGLVLHQAKFDPDSINLQDFDTLTIQQQELFNGEDIEFEAYPTTHRKE